MRSARLGTDLSGEIISKINLAVYKSGSFNGGLEILSRSESGLNPQMLAILDARYELVFGDMVEASDKIQELVEQERFLVSEDLLYAEFLVLREEYQEAESILNQIINDEKNPQWVRNEASDLLANIK
jgi:thioredoxin-like negative regulator of GroEL